jgi:hypothetical protein
MKTFIFSVISIIGAAFWLVMYYVLILASIAGMQIFWTMFIITFAVLLIGKSAYDSFTQKIED